MPRTGLSPGTRPPEQAPEGLDGLAAAEIERRLLEQLRTRPLDLEVARLAGALVHLRRTGATHYCAHSDKQSRLAEERALTPLEQDYVRRWAYPAGSRVRVLGEGRLGIVTHSEVGRDVEGAVAWYVVAIPGLGVCRAHGADEIEPV